MGPAYPGAAPAPRCDRGHSTQATALAEQTLATRLGSLGGGRRSGWCCCSSGSSPASEHHPPQRVDPALRQHLVERRRARRPPPATASISARVSVHGGSRGHRLAVAADHLDDERLTVRSPAGRVRRRPPARAATGAAPAACRSRRPGRRHRRRSSAQVEQVALAVVDRRVRVAVADRGHRGRRDVERRGAPAVRGPGARSPRRGRSRRPPLGGPSPSPSPATQSASTGCGSVWSQGSATSPRSAADQSSSYQRVGSPSATALTPSSSARSSQSRRSWPGGRHGVLLLRRHRLVTAPAGDALGVAAGLAAAVDRGQHHAVAARRRAAPATRRAGRRRWPPLRTRRSAPARGGAARPAPRPASAATSWRRPTTSCGQGVGVAPSRRRTPERDGRDRERGQGDHES